MTQDTRAYGAIDTLLWLGAGVVAFFLILLFWLGSAVEALVAALLRALPQARLSRSRSRGFPASRPATSVLLAAERGSKP